MSVNIEEFSSGYYITELRVSPHRSGPTIEAELFDYIDNKLYASTDAPILMRGQNGSYFEVMSDFCMPGDVIGLPRELMEDLDDGVDGFRESVQENVPVSFFIVKPQKAHYLTESVLGGVKFDIPQDVDVNLIE